MQQDACIAGCGACWKSRSAHGSTLGNSSNTAKEFTVRDYSTMKHASC